MKTPKDYSEFTEAEIKAKINKNNKISTPFAIVSVVATFAIPVGQVTGLFPFWIAIIVMIASLVIAAIFGSRSMKLQEQLEKTTGVTAEKERVREERHDKFLHGLDNNNAAAKPKPPLSDAELAAEIALLTPKIKLYNILGKVITIIGVIGLVPLFIMVPVPFAGFLPVAVGVIFYTRALISENKLKCIVGSSIIRGVLSDTFELTNYSPGCHIHSDVITETKLVTNWNRAGGSDLIEGSYRGVRFSFSDMLLRQVSSGKNSRSVTKFEGQWLIVELKKELPEKVIIREDSKARSDVETENIEFNKKFRIETSDPHTAFFVLTPHFMEYILRINKRANAKTHLCFCGKKAHIALHSGRDLFEPAAKKLYDIKNIDMLRNQMQWDAKYITGIIDELLLNEALFNSEVINEQNTRTAL
jgi:membrane protein implicated in regulation of membrane protease activity